MGLMTIGQFFGEQPSLVPSLPQSHEQRLSDIERIAKTLAKQAVGPTEQWHSFVTPAEDLVRYTASVIECC